jgi:hypothetical protein
MTLSHETVNILNRVGLSVGFVAFWFAAPEFIGETRLRAWEQDIAKALAGFNRLPQTVKAICLALPFFAVYAALASRNHWAGVFGPIRSRWDPFLKDVLGALMAQNEELVGLHEMNLHTKVRIKSYIPPRHVFCPA